MFSTLVVGQSMSEQMRNNTQKQLEPQKRSYEQLWGNLLRMVTVWSI